MDGSAQFISNEKPLILASKSPRRRRLLEQLRLPFRVEVSEVSEKGLSGSPLELVKTLATEKAINVSERIDDHWILGADTVVVIGDIVLGKPENPTHAKEMLQTLSGQTHRVLTGFSLVAPGGSIASCEVITTKVKIKRLSAQEIEAYIHTREPFGKAGGYAIQGIGAFMVEAISGSYTNVVGLPLCAVVKALLEKGALQCFPIASPGT